MTFFHNTYCKTKKNRKRIYWGCLVLETKFYDIDGDFNKFQFLGPTKEYLSHHGALLNHRNVFTFHASISRIVFELPSRADAAQGENFIIIKTFPGPNQPLSPYFYYGLIKYYQDFGGYKIIMPGSDELIHSEKSENTSGL